MKNFVQLSRNGIEIRNEDSDREIKCNYGNMKYLPERGFEDNLDDDIIVENENKCSEVYFLGRGAKVVRRKKCKIIRSVRFHKMINDPENYCREQLMLYTAWQNESKDLIGNCETYQERYKQLNDVITENKKMFEYNGEVLDKAIETLTNELNEFEGVASCTQHNDEQDRNEMVLVDKMCGVSIQM